MSWSQTLSGAPERMLYLRQAFGAAAWPVERAHGDGSLAQRARMSLGLGPAFGLPEFGPVAPAGDDAKFRAGDPRERPPPCHGAMASATNRLPDVPSDIGRMSTSILPSVAQSIRSR